MDPLPVPLLCHVFCQINRNASQIEPKCHSYRGYTRNENFDGHKHRPEKGNAKIEMERYRLGALLGLKLREVQKSFLDVEERLISIKFQTKLGTKKIPPRLAVYKWSGGQF